MADIGEDAFLASGQADGTDSQGPQRQADRSRGFLLTPHAVKTNNIAAAKIKVRRTRIGSRRNRSADDGCRRSCPSAMPKAYGAPMRRRLETPLEESPREPTNELQSVSLAR
jgi:hypothetical protein